MCSGHCYWYFILPMSSDIMSSKSVTRHQDILVVLLLLGSLLGARIMFINFASISVYLFYSRRVFSWYKILHFSSWSWLYFQIQILVLGRLVECKDLWRYYSNWCIYWYSYLSSHYFDVLGSTRGFEDFVGLPPSNLSLPQPPIPISIESDTFPVGEVPTLQYFTGNIRVKSI